MNTANAFMDNSEAEARELLGQLDVNVEFTREPLYNGRNNSVEKVQCPEKTYLLKRYFKDNERFNREVRFYQHAMFVCPDVVPILLTSSEKYQASLLEYLSGRAIAANAVSEDDLEQACNFLCNLNQPSPYVETLPPARDACGCIQGFINDVENRIQRLSTLNPTDYPQVVEFLQSRLAPSWNQVAMTVKNSHLSLEPLNNPVLSPSDFGFHNALRVNKKILFFDFEYAGKDDLCKLTCDFLCQPDIPVPHHLIQFVVSKLSVLSPHPARFAQQIALLLPPCRIKWTCILLNEFLPQAQKRRQFAGSAVAEHTQLSKAIRYFEQAQSLLENTDA